MRNCSWFWERCIIDSPTGMSELGRPQWTLSCPFSRGTSPWQTLHWPPVKCRPTTRSVMLEFFPETSLPTTPLIFTGSQKVRFVHALSFNESQLWDAVVLKWTEISAPFMNSVCSDYRTMSPPNLVHIGHTPFSKHLCRFRVPSKNRRKSDVKIVNNSAAHVPIVLKFCRPVRCVIMQAKELENSLPIRWPTADQSVRFRFIAQWLSTLSHPRFETECDNCTILKHGCVAMIGKCPHQICCSICVLSKTLMLFWGTP